MDDVLAATVWYEGLSARCARDLKHLVLLPLEHQTNLDVLEFLRD